VVAFSSLLMLPARYGCSSSSFVCLLNIEEWQQGVTGPNSIHTSYLGIFIGVSSHSHGCLNLGLEKLKSSSSNPYHLEIFNLGSYDHIWSLKPDVFIYSDLLADLLSKRLTMSSDTGWLIVSIIICLFLYLQYCIF
jgi:hypothetical protein